MRRREYLRSALAGAGLTALTTSALPVDATSTDPGEARAARPAAGTDDASLSTGVAPPGAASRTDTETPTGTDAGSATGSNAQELAPLGHVDISNPLSTLYGATEAVVTPDGSHAFVSRFDGFEVVDLADPSNPEIVYTGTGLLSDGENDTGLTTILDLKYNRDRLLVAAGTSFGFPGFAVYDVSDPTKPRLSTTYEALHSIHNCDLHGRYAYLTHDTVAEIVDIGGKSPEQVGTWSVTGYDDAWQEVPGGVRTVHDLYAQGDRLYVANWDAGAWILDVSDPTDPTAVGHAGTRGPEDLQNPAGSEGTEPPGNAHYVQPNDDGTLLAVGKESWNDPANDEEGETDPQGGPSGITLWDITDPADPVERATIDPPPVPEGEDTTRGGYWTTSHNFDIVGDVLYSSWYQGGVKVHDIADPANPVEVGHWADGYETMFWTAQAAVPGEFFVGTSMSDPDEEGPGGLYAFPDPTDNPATVTPSGPDVDLGTPAGTDPTTGPDPTTTSAGSPSGTPTPSPTPTPTQSPSPSPSADETGDGNANGGTTTGGSGPGFGPLAALGALGVGAWRTLRDDGTDHET